MKEFFALVVLSMPILAVLCIGVLAGFAGWVAARRMNETRTKWMARTAAALAVIIVFTWDEIVGRFYFAYLCAMHAHVKVFQRGQLPLEYWGENGIPNAKGVRNGTRFETQIGDRFYVVTDVEKNYSKIFSIDRDILAMRDRITGNILSELVVLRYWGGWVARTVSLHPTAIHCPSTDGFDDFYRESFVRISGR